MFEVIRVLLVAIGLHPELVEVEGTIRGARGSEDRRPFASDRLWLGGAVSRRTKPLGLNREGLVMREDVMRARHLQRFKTTTDTKHSAPLVAHLPEDGSPHRA